MPVVQFSTLKWQWCDGIIGDKRSAMKPYMHTLHTHNRTDRRPKRWDKRGHAKRKRYVTHVRIKCRMWNKRGHQQRKSGYVEQRRHKKIILICYTLGNGTTTTTTTNCMELLNVETDPHSLNVITPRGHQSDSWVTQIREWDNGNDGTATTTTWYTTSQ